MSIKLPKIHLDSGDPEETKRAKGLLGFLDGQTTNPTLVAKNPEIQAYLAKGKKLTVAELLERYKQMVQAIEKEVAGPISVEVTANWETTASDMLKQAETIATWGRTIQLKFPTTPEGVKAAHEFTKKGGRVNMTLVFTQEQAAAVYTSTLETSQPVFLSPFIARWNDRGFNGMDLLKNTIKMYKRFSIVQKGPLFSHHTKSHVLILAASIRTLDQFYDAIFQGADIITVPYSLLQEWVHQERWLPDEHYRSPVHGVKSILYKDLPFQKDFTQYEITNEKGSLLAEGLTKFENDWNSVVKG